ncbi:protein PET100 homolog, mitochondrial-like [Pomacea canaliculata]|uniref:protein PET100 homolog, mitochondrial-like n=1 Tax=Pomacea canaliculata TaxID=400727 RepID=UPI000D736353|nr:protein PET100 homolog, mitochondrial-like [Pomacea canaliculata]
MGGWKLEVFKMGVYMSFPVTLFYYFNQPAFFQSWMIEKRNQIFPPEEANAKQKINRTIEYLEKREEERKTQITKAA